MAHLSRRKILAATGLIGASVSLPTILRSAPIVAERDPSKDILGIDTSSYPGDSAYDEAWTRLNSRFTCFYLSHSSEKLDPTWNKDVRTRLAMRGWGFIPTYNGTQGDSKLTPAEGEEDAKQAVDLMAKSGFSTGQVIYLDVEKAHADPKDKYWDYVRAWIAKVKSLRYYPGIYSVYPNAGIAASLTSAVWTAELPNGASLTFAEGTTASAIMQNNPSAEELFSLGILSYDPKKYPHGKIYKGSIATQYLFKQYPKEVNGGALELDYNASLISDPSDTSAILAALKASSLI